MHLNNDILKSLSIVVATPSEVFNQLNNLFGFIIMILLFLSVILHNGLQLRFCWINNFDNIRLQFGWNNIVDFNWHWKDLIAVNNHVLKS